MTRKIFSEALEKLSKNEIITNIDGLKNIDYTGFPVYVNVSHTSTPFYIEIVKALPNNSTDPNAIKYKFDVHYKNLYATHLTGPFLMRNPYFLKYFINQLFIKKYSDFKLIDKDYELLNESNEIMLEELTLRNEK